MALAHRRRHVALEQLALPSLHDREPDAPDPAAQQVHAEQPGNQKIDVARSRCGRALIAHGDEIPPAARALQRVVHLEPRELALRARRVVAEHDGVAGDRQQCDSAGAQPQPRSRRIEHRRHEARRRIEGGGQRTVARTLGHGDLRHVVAGRKIRAETGQQAIGARA